MNKIAIIALALVAVAATVASASKVGKHYRSHSGEFDDEEDFGGWRDHHGHEDFDDFEGDFEGHHHGLGGHGLHRLRHNRIHGDHLGAGHHGGYLGGIDGGHHSGHLGGIKSKHLLKKGLKSGGHSDKFRRGGLVHGGHKGGAGGVGIGAIQGAGAAGHLRNEGAIGGLAASHNHIGSHNLAEGHQGSAIGASGHIGAGGHKHGLKDKSGLHKHKVIDSDQTIVKNSVKGVDDVDSFHTRNENDEGGHISGSASGFAGQASGGKLASSKDLEHDHLLAAGAQHETDAGAGFGEFGGVGAGGVGGGFI